MPRWLASIALAALFAPLPALAQRGVPSNGFPTWQERTVLVYVNRARADPQADLAGCAAGNCPESACYTPRPPLAYNYNFNRSARFHSDNLKATGCFQHDSPCALATTLSSALYPPNGTCDGSAACACTTTPTCGSVGTSIWTRIAMFGSGGSGENIAWGYGSPNSVFYAWLWEPTSSSTCGFSMQNGHRYNILTGGPTLGVGWNASNYWTQDFGAGPALAGTLISGTHEPQLSGGSVTFRVNYYNTAGGPQSAVLNIDGTCVGMTQERGAAATNATWASTQSLSGTTCRRYQFVFQDPAGATVLLPETGSYGVGGSLASCPDWSATPPPACGAINEPPTITTAASATPNPVTASTSAVAVRGTDDGGEPSLTYTWSATGPAAVSFSPNGTNAAKNATATFTRAGTYVVTATLADAQGLTVASPVTVIVAATPTSISVSPATASVIVGGTRQFTATAADQFGLALATQPAFTFSVAGGGTISSTGLFTAGSTPGGPFLLTAASGALSGTASVTVASSLPPTIATAAAASPNPVIATTTTASVLGADDRGEAALTYTWSATGPAAVTFAPNGTNAAKSSTATFTRAGTYTFLVTVTDADGQTVTSSVAVTVSQTYTAVGVTPANASVATGATQPFLASSNDQFGDAMPSQPNFRWSVSGGGTIGNSSGVFVAGATPGGPFTVTASGGGKSGTTSVSVVAGSAPTVATAASATPNPAPGSTSVLTVLGADDGGEPALTYRWSATGPGAVTFSPNGTNAAKSSTATFAAVGSYVLTATISDAGGLTVTSAVTVVVSPTLTSLVVTPATASVVSGGTQQFTATGRDQFGAALAAQPSVTWAVSGGGTISGAGLFSATTVGGPFTVTASSGLVSGTAAVTVSSSANLPPTVATAASATPSPVSGTTTAVSVLGADDGGEAALLYTWSASGPAAVTFSASGTNAAKNANATFTAAGSYVLTVTLRDAGGLTVTSAVTVVVNATLTSVTLSPPSASILLGDTQLFTATAKDQFGAALAVQPSFTWTASGGGTVSSAGAFLSTAVGGPYTVTATAGTVSGSANVTVTVGLNTPPTIATPAAATPNPVQGTQTTLSVLGDDDSGEAALLYTWSLSGPAAATVSPNGTHPAKSATATFTAPGTYTAVAEVRDLGGLTATSTVSVQVVSTAAAVTLSPPAASLQFGSTVAFAASVDDQFGAALSPQPTVTWSTTGGTISPSGLFTATAVGTFTVTATAASLSGSAVVRVAPGLDSTAPTVAVDAPAAGSTLKGPFRIVASASDVDDAISRVTFLLDGQPLGECTQAPWELTADTAAFALGAHTLLARAADSSGNEAISAPVAVRFADGTAPLVTLDSPAPGAVVGLQTNLSATATDDVGVVRVEFMLDGAESLAVATGAPWTASVSLPVGAHELTAVAYDAEDNAGTSEPVKVTVSDGSPALGRCGCGGGGGPWTLAFAVLALAWRRRPSRAGGRGTVRR